MAYGQIVITNASTGETTMRDMTPAEIAARDTERAVAQIDSDARDALRVIQDADLSELRAAKLAASIQSLSDDLDILIAGAPTVAQNRDILTHQVRGEIALLKALSHLI